MAGRPSGTAEHAIEMFNPNLIQEKGWHAEVAVHILRLALSGALDRHPRLKLLIGHMGECLPTMMDRVERVFSSYSRTHLDRNAARAI
jgi:hypothetical protein